MSDWTLLQQYSEKHMKVLIAYEFEYIETYEGLEGSSDGKRMLGRDPRGIWEVKVGMI